MVCCPKEETLVSPVVKYTLVVVNLILWICSIGVIGVGVWAYVETTRFFYQPVESIYDILLNLPIIIMVVGVCNFLTTFCGFVGALRENICLLKIFYISILIVFLCELTGAVLTFVFLKKASAYLTGFFRELFILRYQDDENAIIDFFQENYGCCGINTYTDWNDNEYFNCTTTNPSGLKCAVPYSCCKDPDSINPGIPNILCGGGALSNDSSILATIYQDGCLQTMIQYADNNLPIIGVVGIGVLLPQLVGIILGCLLDKQVGKQRNRFRNSDVVMRRRRRK